MGLCLAWQKLILGAFGTVALSKEEKMPMQNLYKIKKLIKISRPLKIITLKNVTKDYNPFYGNFTGSGPNADPDSLYDGEGRLISPTNMVDLFSQKHADYYWMKGAQGDKRCFNRYKCCLW